MANYSLVIDSTFQPFSFERYLQPSQIYDAAYKEVEDNLSELETEAGQWEKLANEETDPKTHATYKKYADDLRKQADKLSKYGLNPQSRREMLNMKKRYASEIVPITKAYERRRQLADEQRQRNADGTWRFDVDYDKVSLDDLVDNPEMSYSAVSGTDIMNKASQMFARLATVINNEPDVQKRKDLRGYLQVLQQSGYDPAVALQEYGAAMPAEIKRVYDTIDTSFANNPAYDKEWGHSWIGQGAYSAIGQKNYNIMDDKMVMSAAQAASNALGWASHKETVRHNQAMEEVARARTNSVSSMPASPKAPSEIVDKNGNIDMEAVKGLSTKNKTERGSIILGDAVVNIAEPQTIMYGDAWNRKGHFTKLSDASGFTNDKTGITSFSFGDLLRESNKKVIDTNSKDSEYTIVTEVKNWFQASTGINPESAVGQELLSQLVVYEDSDWGTDNEYAISWPGTAFEKAGVKGDKASYTNFVNRINTHKAAAYTVGNTVISSAALEGN